MIPILLARSKWAATKSAKYEIKIKKGAIPCGLSTAVDPAKRDARRPRIELAMFNFRMEHCRLMARAPDRVSFLGMSGSIPRGTVLRPRDLSDHYLKFR